MKLLVIGDFHGRFPNGIKKVLKSENINIILSCGDYSGNEKLSKLFFEYYHDSESEASIKIEKEIKKLEKKSIRDGVQVVKELKKLKIKFFGVRGNWDPLPWEKDVGHTITKKEKAQERKDANKLIRLETRYFKFIDFKLKDMGSFILVGGTSSSYPAKINKKTLREVEEEYGQAGVKRRVKQYNWRVGKYEKLFLRARKFKKPVIFLTHNCPYETKLDKVKKGPVKGEHYGSFIEKQIIRRFKPDLVLCGHMHENQGRDKVGRSVIVNSGASFEKKYAIIDWDEKKRKVKKVKFVK
jgi:Icc-related predicted phosphoesterase